MHVASLPSSVQSRNKSMPNGVAGSSSYSSGNINQLPDGDWGQRTSEMLLSAEREQRVALGVGSGGSSGEFSSIGEVFSIHRSGTDSGDVDREAVESKCVEDNAGANRLPPNSPSSGELLEEVLIWLGPRRAGFGERSPVPCARLVLTCVRVEESHLF